MKIMRIIVIAERVLLLGGVCTATTTRYRTLSCTYAEDGWNHYNNFRKFASDYYYAIFVKSLRMSRDMSTSRSGVAAVENSKLFSSATTSSSLAHHFAKQCAVPWSQSSSIVWARKKPPSSRLLLSSSLLLLICENSWMAKKIVRMCYLWRW